jgi:transcriptional regulator with XRE-family HTH domain
MHELYLRRRENLRLLVKTRGGQNQFASELGYTKGWLSQLIGKSTNREISEKVAREIEQLAGVSAGSLDEELETNVVGTQAVQSDLAAVLATNLHNLMAMQGTNQAELARRASMATTSVNRVFIALDNGVSPRLEALAGIARGLGVHPSELLKEDPAIPAASPYEPPRTIARQVSRLVEDFLLCAPEQRLEILRLVAEASNENEARGTQRQ